MDLVHIIDGLIGIIVLGGGYYLTTQGKELKRVEKSMSDVQKKLETVVQQQNNGSRFPLDSSLCGISLSLSPMGPPLPRGVTGTAH